MTDVKPKLRDNFIVIDSHVLLSIAPSIFSSDDFYSQRR